jgi:hypothetical protein
LTSLVRRSRLRAIEFTPLPTAKNLQKNVFTNVSLRGRLRHDRAMATQLAKADSHLLQAASEQSCRHQASIPTRI